ncbi:MAG: ribosome maturation factor RimP [Pyrinomonadaceae bacterium]
MDKNSIIDKVRETASKTAKKNLLEVVHVEITGPGGNPTVRIFIDKEDGVTHDDCSLISSEIGDFLDRNDLISSEYVLEVSSPGIERGLYSIGDFEKFAGRSAKVKTFKAIDGQKNFRGKIAGVSGGRISFDDVTNGNVEFSFDEVAKANLEFDTAEELKEAKKRHSK